ncbi:MAG: 4-hydroxybenzoate octaprenyltransferase [Aestuariivirga sp.]
MSDARRKPPEIADAKRGSFVGALPANVVPFAQMMRLDRPIGWWLLLLPCWWGLLLSQLANGERQPNWWIAALFLVGAIVMRAAGCIVNDLADRDIDAKVERTRNRPLASGRVSIKAALVLLGLLLAVGLAILLQFNTFTVLTGIASLLIVAIYPLMKRITYYPQFVLGLAFNWGALLGWTAMRGKIELPAILLYLGGISWTMAYDTIYAHQDKEDDAIVGVKSTALKFGDSSIFWLAGFFALALNLIDFSLWQVKAPWPAHAGVFAAACHALWQLKRFDGNDSTCCLKLFRANRIFGLLIVCGLLIGLMTK